MRYRQIHLDYHNSPRLPNLAADFDAAQFARQLEEARVDSVNLFSKCVHGWSYHPTEIGGMHPGLSFNLLRAQMDAVHGRGIKAPIYLCAGWDEKAAHDQPGWRLITGEGQHLRNRDDGPLGTGWCYMDFSSPYLDYFVRQVAEAARMFPDADGFWIDICAQSPSASPWAQDRMEASGLDWTNPGHRDRFAEQVQFELFDRVGGAIRAEVPAAKIFFNFGHLRRGRRDALSKYDYFDIESLPTTYWGYDHFPISARYIEQFGRPMTGMSGKFHHSWGEIGSYKSDIALKIEAATMVAHGAACCFGDHLAPDGRLDPATYDGIRRAYSYIEALEPWLRDTSNVAQIGVFSAEGMRRPLFSGDAAKHDSTDEGVVRALLDGKFTFDVLDAESDLQAYSLLILPDVIDVPQTLFGRLKHHLAGGGHLLLTGASGIGDTGFLFDAGADFEGMGSFVHGDYLIPAGPLARASQPASSRHAHPLFMYSSATRMSLRDGEPLGEVVEPHFDRSPRHFSGHVQTPPRPTGTGRPAGVRKGAITYFGHPVFGAYAESGAPYLLDLIRRLVSSCLPSGPDITTSLPVAGRVTLRRQAAEDRDVLHVIHANPALRGRLQGDAVQVIHDVVKLRQVEFTLKATRPVLGVTLVPQGTEVAFTVSDGRLVFLTDIEGTQVLEVKYG